MFKILGHRTSIISFILLVIQMIATLSCADPEGTQIIVNENATNPYIREVGDTDISAHRSGADIAPQNTLMAFEKVLKNNKKYNVDIFEFDIQITKDGQLVLLHNDTYDATSNSKEAFGKSNVSPKDYTLEELQVLNLGENFMDKDGNYPYRGLRGKDIPNDLRVVTLDSILDYIEKNSKGQFTYIIEIKSSGTWCVKACDRLYEVLSERNLLDRAITASFNPIFAIYKDKTYPDMQRSANIGEVLKFYTYCRGDWDLADADVNYIALHIPYGDSVSIGDRMMINVGTKQLINYAHKYDIAVQYWTINSVDDAVELIENGADAIMTDDPSIMTEAFKKAFK